MCVLQCVRLCSATEMNTSRSLPSKSSWPCKGEKHKEKSPFNMKISVVVISKKLDQKKRKKLVGRGEI